MRAILSDIVTGAVEMGVAPIVAPRALAAGEAPSALALLVVEVVQLLASGGATSAAPPPPRQLGAGIPALVRRLLVSATPTAARPETGLRAEMEVMAIPRGVSHTREVMEAEASRVTMPLGVLHLHSILLSLSCGGASRQSRLCLRPRPFLSGRLPLRPPAHVLLAPRETRAPLPPLRAADLLDASPRVGEQDTALDAAIRFTRRPHRATVGGAPPLAATTNGRDRPTPSPA